MIRVNIPEPDPVRWAEWLRLSGAATNECIAAYDASDKIRFRLGVYKYLKPELSIGFCEKCAFCESRITQTQPGDVEHFRPKAGVQEEDGTTVLDPHGEPHPGYYWLAYEWGNLLFACVECNRPRNDRMGRRGKANRFPVESFRAFRPGEEGDEISLLVNPRFEEPSDHFFCGEDGIMVGLTTKGLTTIRILGLNREALIDARRRSALRLKGLFLALTVAVAQRNADEMQGLMPELQAVHSGADEYALMGRIIVREQIACVSAALAQITT
jgi:hypothetical protein